MTIMCQVGCYTLHAHSHTHLVWMTGRMLPVALLLRDLHKLWSLECIDYKLVVLVLRCLHGLAPGYHSLTTSNMLATPTPLSPIIVILAVSDPTNTAYHHHRPCLSGRGKSSLEKPATWCHISSKSLCSPKLSSFHIHFCRNSFQYTCTPL